MKVEPGRRPEMSAVCGRDDRDVGLNGYDMAGRIIALKLALVN
jgi:hypothetical protein